MRGARAGRRGGRAPRRRAGAARVAGPARPRPRAGRRPGGVLLARPVPGAGRARVDGALRRAARPAARTARRRRAGGLRHRGPRGALGADRRDGGGHGHGHRPRAGRRSAAAQRRARAGHRRARAAGRPLRRRHGDVLAERRPRARPHAGGGRGARGRGTRPRRGAAQPDRPWRRSRCPARAALSHRGGRVPGPAPLRAVRAPRAPHAPRRPASARARGGLRADVLRGGDLRVGDPVEALD